jgi:phage antirepressor YoqD-like protein
MTKDALERAIAEPDFLIQLATTLKEEKAKRLEAEQQCEAQKQIIGEMEKKVSYLDLILSSTSTVTITQIAQDYGMSGQKMNKLLHGLRIQYKVGDQWILYAEYKDKCYVSSETIHFVTSEGVPCTTLNTKWTQKGRLFLYDILKKEGILPKMEWAEKVARDKNDPNETRNSDDLE